MSFRSIDEQKTFLEQHLTKINEVISEYLEVDVNLQIQERRTYRGERYLKLIDDKNFCNDCGIMSRAWKKVVIDTFNIWWEPDGAILDMHFSYEHIDGGSNGARFCNVEVFGTGITIA